MLKYYKIKYISIPIIIFIKKNSFLYTYNEINYKRVLVHHDLFYSFNVDSSMSTIETSGYYATRKVPVVRFHTFTEFPPDPLLEFPDRYCRTFPS